MVEMNGLLAKVAKVTKFVVLSTEDDSSENSDVLKVEIAHPLRVTSSIPFNQGKEVTIEKSVIYVGQDNIAAFKEGLQEEDGQIVYTGSLKLDVSKPKTRVGRDGKAEITQGSRIWLTATRFNRMGAKSSSDRRQASISAIAQLFGQASEALNDIVDNGGVEVTLEENVGG